jgi:hypothetical protein
VRAAFDTVRGLPCRDAALRTVDPLPGREQVHQSLLTFAEEAVERRGAQIHRLWWHPPRELGLVDLVSWVREQVAAELDRLHLERPLLVAKSLGTLAAPIAAAGGLPAVWFTPVMHEDVFADLYVEASAPRLFVGGTADPLWNGDLARRLSPHVLEIADADHGMFVPGPLADSGRVHGEVGTTVERFLDDVVWPD